VRTLATATLVGTCSVSSTRPRALGYALVTDGQIPGHEPFPYAARNELKGLPRHEVPSAWATIKQGWYYLLVVALLIVMLLHFKRESHAPFYATTLWPVLNQLFS
jgi:hypothetical protein